MKLFKLQQLFLGMLWWQTSLLNLGVFLAYLFFACLSLVLRIGHKNARKGKEL